MTLLLDPKAREAVIHGPPRILMEGAAQTVMANIARRVAEAPDGLIRSFQTDGSVRQETFAELWRRSGEIATQLRTLGVGPGSQAVLLLRDLLDFVPSCWASLRVGAIPFRSPASSTAPRRKSLRFLRRAWNVPRSSPIQARPTSTGSRVCSPMRRSCAFRRSRTRAIKTWIPMLSPIISVCSRPRARPGM